MRRNYTYTHSDGDFMYYSKVTHKPYETKEELIEAEKEALKVQKEKEEKELAAKKEAEELKTKRADRAKEIEDAYEKVRRSQKELHQLVNKFCEDYGSFHMTVRDPFPMTNWFDDFFNKFLF